MKQSHDRKEYQAALGEMVDVFALVEYAVFYYLFHRVGLTAREAAALFSGSRASASIDLIRRLFSARELSLPEPVDASLAQLRKITSFRNLLLHYGTHADADGNQVTSDWPMSMPTKDLRLHPADVATLRAASEDLVVIMQCLFMFADHDNPDLSRLPDISARVESARRSAWRYIPPPQHPKNSTPR